jgi:hypothetical protein
MNNIKKQQIVNALTEYCERYGSQNRAAKSLDDVSTATISQMLNNNWDLIRDEMWRSVASQIGVKLKEWNAVPTSDHILFSSILKDAKEDSQVFIVVGKAGSGKTFTTDHFRSNNKNVFTIKCDSFWNKKKFITEILKEMGIEFRGLTESEMIDKFKYGVLKLQNPLLIFDEADKLSDAILYDFISIYNRIEDECGIVLCATQYLEMMLRNGLLHNKKGFEEIWSRGGKRCVHLNGVTAADIVLICEGNGVTDTKSIERVINESDSDIRRVKKMIYAIKKSRNANKPLSE